MDQILFDFFLKVCFKYLEAKYWTYWTLFNKYFIPIPYLKDKVSYEIFPKAQFKYLGRIYLDLLDRVQ